MTADELYKIVKDVPREAWPEKVVYDWNLHGPKKNKQWRDVDVRLSVPLAELMFIGSMVRWLYPRGVFLGTSFNGTYWPVNINMRDHRFGNYKTPLEALAAACIEVGDSK